MVHREAHHDSVRTKQPEIHIWRRNLSQGTRIFFSNGWNEPGTIPTGFEVGVQTLMASSFPLPHEEVTVIVKNIRFGLGADPERIREYNETNQITVNANGSAIYVGTTFYVQGSSMKHE